MTPRPPWEIVETFPSTDAALRDRWEAQLSSARDRPDRIVALVGRALTSYWAVQEGLASDWRREAERREADTSEATALAERSGDADLLATALLGELYARWGPDHLPSRPAIVTRLERLRPDVTDEELRLRIREWIVLGHFDVGDLPAVRAEIDRFAEEAARTGLRLFLRRERLWRANLAMLEGRIDEALAMNQEAIRATAAEAGSPFSFQNVAITVAVERFFRCGLDDVLEAIRSIRASSPRVGANWDVGLAFALAESGRSDEAAELFDSLAADGFAALPRDLNWLVTVQLLGLIALHVDDRSRIRPVLELLAPFAALDATHGSGYASYGPVGRVVGSLAARCGDLDEAERCFDAVLETRSPGPWRSLTILDRCRALRQRDPGAATAGAARAASELRAFGMQTWAGRAEQLRAELQLEGHGAPIARLAEGTWTLRFGSEIVSVPDSVGMRYLTSLLARPGREMSVTELDTATDPGLPSSSSVFETSDAVARRAYRRRLDELDASPGDAADRRERDFLRRELQQASHARASSAELERARVRVTKALRRAIDAVAGQSPALGDHLSTAVETGRRCSYTPATGQPWDIIERPARTDPP